MTVTHQLHYNIYRFICIIDYRHVSLSLYL